MNLRATKLNATIATIAVLTLSAIGGCTRSWFRQQADEDAYRLLASRQVDALWQLPDRPVEPDPRSRMADLDCPDCGARPPDDATASWWVRDEKCRELAYYQSIPESPEIEYQQWFEFLDRNAEGQVRIDRETSISLGLLHSRDYQDQVESVYLQALSLSGNRFDFALQWLGGTDTGFDAAGDDLGGDSSLSQSHSLGVSRSLATGGQLAANLLNSFTWTSGAGDAISSSLALSLTQPLLRGAFRQVRLETLTQAERDLLYAVRTFARFRRQFYLEITRSYLRLLTQIQSVRNQRSNLVSLELNLREHQELLRMGSASQIQVDQVFQQYQSGRIDLFSSEQGLENSYDAFKFQLGLPPSIDLALDESILDGFTLTSPELDQLQTDIEAHFQTLIRFLPPEPAPLVALEEFTARSIDYSQLLEQTLPAVRAELDQWKEQLDAGPPANASPETRLDWDQQRSVFDQIQLALADLQTELDRDRNERSTWVETLRGLNETERWGWASQQIGQRLREHVGILYVIQTQIRLFLINTKPFQLSQQPAVQLALERRLDLMNQQAAVSDAFRKVEVAANALQSDLDLRGGVTLSTEPGQDNPVRFDSSSAQYEAGLEWDGPLNRFNERNAYRASQIAYQQSRRRFMAVQDSIANQVRSDLRELRISELNFQISRQQLITAIRQVEEAQINLRRTTEPNSNLTRDLLQALQGLLAAKNNLISNWIDYEINRIQLFVDLELLLLDENGTWLNADDALGDMNVDRNDVSNGPGETRSRDSSGLLPAPNGSE